MASTPSDSFDHPSLGPVGDRLAPVPVDTAANQLPSNVVLLRGRGPSGRVGPIGQTDVSEPRVVEQLLAAAQAPLEAYRQQLFRMARAGHEQSTIVDWWHAGQARRSIDAACIQFARLAPTAQRRVLAALPRPAPRLIDSAAGARQADSARVDRPDRGRAP